MSRRATTSRRSSPGSPCRARNRSFRSGVTAVWSPYATKVRSGRGSGHFRLAEVSLNGFGGPNVLDDLLFDDLGPGWVDAARTRVTLPSNNGLDGTFRCCEAMILG